MRMPSLISGVAKRLQRAVHTPRLPRQTNLPAMVNQLMRKSDPPVLRNDLHQIPLHLLRRRLLRQLQPPRQPHHMRIDHHPNRNPIPRTQHHIPGLPRHPRQRQNLLHRLRNLPAERLCHHPCRPLNRLRLIPKKSSRPNQLFKLRKGSSRHSLRSRKSLEQLRRHKIDPNIRTLRRKYGGDRQLPRIPVMQRANHIRISLPQRLQNRCDALRRSRIFRPNTCLLRCASFNRFCRHHQSLPCPVELPIRWPCHQFDKKRCRA